MGIKLMFSNPKSISFEEYDERPLNPDEVRLKTIFSGISQGTELTMYRGNNPYLSKKWDSEKRLFVNSSDTSISYPTETGYEAVGEIIEKGESVKRVKEGDIVYGGEWFGWTHKTTHILSEKSALRQKIPNHINPEYGVFMALLQTAFNGVLDAQINLGEFIVVFGAGIVGQLINQFLKLSGATTAVVDLIDERLKIAEQLGADIIINPTNTDIGDYIKTKTNGKGADACIEATGSDRALHEAIRCCAYSSKVVCVGFNPNSASNLYLGEEFHHNRINLISSQISGVNPLLLNRWDEFRVEDTVADLMYAGKIKLEPLITHRYNFFDAEKAYEVVDKTPEAALQVILKY